MLDLAYRFSLLLLILSTWSTHLAAETSQSLRLGIMPFNSTLALIKTHQPLRQHLQKELGQSIDIYTSANYVAFQQDSMAGAFDLLITGPHFGVMSLEAGYIPLVRYNTTLQPIFVVRKSSKIRTVEDFKGKHIGLPNQLSVSAIGGLSWLREQGLLAGRDFTVVEKPTHGAAIAAVTVGDLDAALTTYTPLKQIPNDIRDHIEFMPTEVMMPHLMTLTHERLGKGKIQQILEALNSFPATPEGEAFFKNTGYHGYIAVDNEGIEKLYPYVPIVKELMQK
ncbi:MAG: phosphate/phosphite/phosphonate ABC transporter substrate-binding protein [Candidatus Thiodiazotropha sp. 6PLUC2]